ncbi:MAG: nucleotidyltransferase domain-containing protein [Lentisphaeria bacterium]|jgi:predicted nucleotidyltransferase|nr:nucleotidyltransferase domain-containing protein [Lentisphaeria bacterium]
MSFPADQLLSFLQSESSLQLAILFGSAARDALRPDSDIDLALQYDPPLSLEARLDLTFRLESLLRRTVDLVDLSQASGTLLKEILCHGKILIKRDSSLLFSHLQKMLCHQADMQPYIRRTQLQRQKSFQHGK